MIVILYRLYIESRLFSRAYDEFTIIAAIIVLILRIFTFLLFFPLQNALCMIKLIG